MKTDLFQSCGHCWVFQICWHIECITLTALSFRIWNSSTGIPSPPLVVFIVLLSKAYLTSHSRMSGCRWAIRALRLSGSWRSFVYSSVYSCHLFLISLLLLGPFLSFIVPLFAWKVPFVSLIFLKSSLIFPIPLFSTISLHWSLRKAFLFLLAILWNSVFRWVYLSFSPLLFASLLYQLFVRHFRQTFCLFAFLFHGDSFDHCLLFNVTNLCPQFFRYSIRSNHLNQFLLSLYNCKGFI